MSRSENTPGGTYADPLYTYNLLSAGWLNDVIISTLDV